MSILVYLRGGLLPGTEIYFSDNGALSFQGMNSDTLVSGWGKGEAEVALGRPHPPGSVGD